MNERTLTALKKSIDHWTEIAYHGGISDGSNNCALCKEFDNVNCDGCPVNQSSGSKCCLNTPYAIFDKYCISEERSSRVFDEKSKQLALDQLNFLKSLLPKDKIDDPLFVSEEQMFKIRKTYILNNFSKLRAIKMFKNEYLVSIREAKKMVELVMKQDPMLKAVINLRKDHIERSDSLNETISNKNEKIYDLEETIVDLKETIETCKSTMEHQVSVIESDQSTGLTNWIREACDWEDNCGFNNGLSCVLDFLNAKWEVDHTS